MKKEDKAESKEATATINIAGDIIMHKPFLTSSVYKNGDDYDYNPIFQYVKVIIMMQIFLSVRQSML